MTIATVWALLCMLLSQPVSTNSPACVEVSERLFGISMERVGDFDGDGIDELAVGHPGVGPQCTGDVWILSVAKRAPLRRFSGPKDAQGFGGSFAQIGDVDADGVGDLVVGCAYLRGARASPIDVARWNEPSAAICISGASGAVLHEVRGARGHPWFADVGFAEAPVLCSVGDWNDDGIGDYAAGWPCAGGIARESGRVDLVSGSDGSVLRRWYGIDSREQLGVGIARLDDLDRDGLSELALASLAPSVAGKHSGLRVISSRTRDDLFVVRDDAPSRSFGVSVVSIGDWNGDGTHDLAVSRPDDAVASHPAKTSAAEVQIRSGRDGSLLHRVAAPPLAEWLGPLPRDRSEAPHGEVHESFGARLARIVDRDGDGRDDCIVTAPVWSVELDVAAVVMTTSTARVLARATVPYDANDSYVGTSLVVLDDLDGDGIAEWAVGGASVRCFECPGLVLVCSGKSGDVLWKVRRKDL